ncbi:hypothetical protein [Diaminobutyricibacter sp. McL0608]|uniref:hypothetical protein n=1 Tax=Leifsonia sp. McL0608 TaxID=3143537 RepID=UPI0031F2E3E5
MKRKDVSKAGVAREVLWSRTGGTPRTEADPSARALPQALARKGNVTIGQKPPVDEHQRTRVFMSPGKPLEMWMDAVMERSVRDVDWPNLSRDQVIEHVADLHTNLTRGSGS